MSYETALDHFVNPMRRRFTVPSGMDQKSFLDDMADALDTYGQTQLASAATWFRDNRDVRAFPTVAECKRVIERFPTDEQRSAALRIGQSQTRQAEDWRVQRERELAAFKLCRCGMGRQADREGWLPALIEFCTDHQRLPEDFEVNRVQAMARRSEDSLAAMRPARPGPDDAPDPAYGQRKGLHEACQRWRQIMLDRAHDKVFGWLERNQSAPDRAA